MTLRNAVVKTFAILAILFLLGFGFVAYAFSPALDRASLESNGSPTGETAAAIGNSLSYSLIPLPVYLHQTPRSNYSFKEGGALIVISGDVLRVTTSIIGSANTAFSVVLQTGDRNLTIGSVTSTSSGSGLFKGNTTLASGTYHVGLLVFSSGKTSGLVAVSDPRAYSITLGTATSTSTTSTTSSATSTRSSTTSSASTSHEETRTSTTSLTTTTNSEPSQSSRSNAIEFTPVKTSTAPKGYGYGEGGGEYAITGGTAYFSLDFAGQNPSTHYLVVLSVNGTARTIGNYTTDGEGVGKLGASTTLGTGTFVLGLTVVDSSSFSTPTLVLASVPSSFIVNIQATSTTTTSTTTSTTSTTATSESTPRGEGPSWEFKLVAVPVTNATAGYRFATSGTAVVSLSERYSLLDVELGFQDGNPSTAYKVALSLNGTIVDVGAMTTNKDGGAVLQAEIQVNPGRYMLGVLVYDISTFKDSNPVLVMVSSPNTQLALIASSTLETSSSSSSSSSSSTSQGSTQATTALTTTAKTIDAGTDVENEIEHAVNNLTIPATIEVTPLSSSTKVLDSRFSISVGQQVGNGLIVAISGTNVTGPRVLLINMSRTSPLALYPALNVTLDGIPVVEASSSLQVLNPVAGDPARYVLVATSTSIQLLVSIPHFSLHLIQVAGVIVQAIQTSLVLDAPLLAGSVLVITLAFAVAYAARKRVSTVLL